MMFEMISSFFAMIWALVGVIFQLALPVLFIIIVIWLLGKVAKPIINDFVNYIFRG